MVREYPNGPLILVRAEGAGGGDVGGVTLAEQRVKSRGPRGPYKKSEIATTSSASTKANDSAAPLKRVMDYNAIVAAASTAQSAAAHLHDTVEELREWQ